MIIIFIDYFLCYLLNDQYLYDKNSLNYLYLIKKPMLVFNTISYRSNNN